MKALFLDSLFSAAVCRQVGFAPSSPIQPLFWLILWRSFSDDSHSAENSDIFILSSLCTPCDRVQTYKVCKLSNETDFLCFSNINVIPFTPMETLFPLLVAALEVNWYGLQHVCYNRKNKCFDLDRITNEEDFFIRVITGDELWIFNTILRSRGKVRRGTLWALLGQRKLEWANRRSNQCWFDFFREGKSSFYLNIIISSNDVISRFQKIYNRV